MTPLPSMVRTTQVVPIVYGASIAASMRVSLRHSGSQTTDRFAETLRAGGDTRIARSREPYERTGWRNRLGKPDATDTPVGSDEIEFGLATWRDWARDGWSRWPADLPAANFRHRIRRYRLFELPGVRIHHLASRLPRMAARRIANGRQAHDPVRPAIDRSHVNPGTFGYRQYRAGRTVAMQTGVGTAFGDGPADDSRCWIAGLDHIWKHAAACPDKRTVATPCTTRPFPSISCER